MMGNLFEVFMPRRQCMRFESDVKRELDIPEDCRVVLPIIVGHPRLPTVAKERSNPTVLCWR